MGVKLRELLVPKTGSGGGSPDNRGAGGEMVRFITIENLRGKTLAVDARNWLYQFLATIRGPDGRPFTNPRGDVTSHLIGLFYRNINFIERDLKPIYVFDGSPLALKKKTLEKRRQVKQEATEKMVEAQLSGDFETARKHASATSKITKDMTKEAKDLLVALGLPVVQALHDGEALAAYMVAKGDVWAVASQDYDTFLFGAERLVRNLNIAQSRRVGTTYLATRIEWYSLQSVLSGLGLTREQLVDVGILVGTDFHDGVPKVGPKTAYRLVKEHGSARAVIEADVVVRKVRVRDHLDLETYEKIRRIFLEPNVTDDYRGKLRWRRPDLARVREILVDRNDFDPQRVDASLRKLRKKVASGRQETMDAFLRGGK
ncbi:MAG: flap endonuclease-1 [Promethearchaeota archaeon]